MQKIDTVVCGVCGVNAVIKRVNYDLRGKTLINVIHGSKDSKDTVEHSFATFEPDRYLVPPAQSHTNTLSTIIETKEEIKQRKKDRNPQYIKCPRCGETGRFNEYHPRLDKRPEMTRYYVKHEYLPGYWGSVDKVRRFRRCYFSKESLIPYIPIN